MKYISDRHLNILFIFLIEIWNSNPFNQKYISGPIDITRSGNRDNHFTNLANLEKKSRINLMLSNDETHPNSISANDQLSATWEGEDWLA